MWRGVFFSTACSFKKSKNVHLGVAMRKKCVIIEGFADRSKQEGVETSSDH
jgi:hypothetical protein